MQHLTILMATYNGGKFIEAQLDSLLAQSFAGWRLWIRDDGSSDDTVEIIRRFVAQDERVQLLPADGTRRGAAMSFSHLMARFAEESEYTMFCDQDDVWQPDKIAVTLAKMREMEARCGAQTPILVHTNLSVADCDLNLLPPTFWHYQGLNPEIRSLNRLLVQNNVTGCTVMTNRALAKLAGHLPPQAIMHDWWLALVAAAFGEIGYVARATMLYRQHGGNDTGAKRYGIAQVLHHMKRGVAPMSASLLKTQRQAGALLERHAAALAPAQRLLLETYAGLAHNNFFMRRWLVCRLGTFMNGLLRNLGMMVAL